MIRKHRINITLSRALSCSAFHCQRRRVAFSGTSSCQALALIDSPLLAAPGAIFAVACLNVTIASYRETSAASTVCVTLLWSRARGLQDLLLESGEFCGGVGLFFSVSVAGWQLKEDHIHWREKNEQTHTHNEKAGKLITAPSPSSPPQLPTPRFLFQIFCVLYVCLFPLFHTDEINAKSFAVKSAILNISVSVPVSFFLCFH